jgi:hypothetical protein
MGQAARAARYACPFTVGGGSPDRAGMKKRGIS